MRCQYVIQPGDTFEKIAIQFYNNPVFAENLRYYNGLYNSSSILVGQPIDIPSNIELYEPACCSADKQASTCRTARSRPQGYQQLLNLYGNIYDYFDEDGCFNEAAWCANMISWAELPFPVALSWDHSRLLRRVRCHVKMVDTVFEVFQAVQKAGLSKEIITLGDFYNFRSRRSSGKLSTHCWGIAFDVNPEINVLGSKGSISDRLVKLFGEFGFMWGGHSKGTYREPMHFQYCIGY